MTVALRRTTSRDDDFLTLIRRLDAELRARYGDIEDVYAPFNVVETDTVVIATIDGVVVGCGCFKQFDDETIELKRFFVDPARRDAGIGRAVIGELETWAKQLGYRASVLETGVKQVAAIALYERTGYQRTPLYGPYVGMENLSICMRKQLS